MALYNQHVCPVDNWYSTHTHNTHTVLVLVWVDLKRRFTFLQKDHLPDSSGFFLFTVNVPQSSKKSQVPVRKTNTDSRRAHSGWSYFRGGCFLSAPGSVLVQSRGWWWGRGENEMQQTLSCMEEGHVWAWAEVSATNAQNAGMVLSVGGAVGRWPSTDLCGMWKTNMDGKPLPWCLV